MSLPQESGYDDEVLTRYVLGLLPDADRERVDEASIADDEVASWLRIAETDLIDGVRARDPRRRDAETI